MLIDTDVIIWYMNGNMKALNTIEKYNGFSISVITYMELVQGMRNKNELNLLRKALKSWETKINYVTEEISSRAMFYIEQHFLSHSMQLADALIVATAVSHGIPLITGNTKHYKIIKELELIKFQP
ncbi:MAG: type II toxin-antitoxin system VapC family toxin [gamma proteobacterium symbiont of Taylorina sp.]|nr:type II toxin-antitoxin system VapC family toxin [gamma proteobacterium symbiont of Taylorina sp.]